MANAALLSAPMGTGETIARTRAVLEQAGEPGGLPSQNASGNAVRSAQRQPAATPFPAGRRVPKGTLRWYPVRVPEGREAAAAERLRKLASAGALDDAVVVSRERWFKRAGAWSVQTQPLYRGYVFVVSRDAAALGRELDKLGLHGDARQEGGRPVPLADDVRQWIAASMDGAGVLRASEGVIEGGILRVTKGPLAGQEERVAKVDRHRRVCEVRVGREGGRDVVERMALNVPEKS